LHQVGDLFELNAKPRCQNVNKTLPTECMSDITSYTGHRSPLLHI